MRKAVFGRPNLLRMTAEALCRGLDGGVCSCAETASDDVCADMKAWAERAIREVHGDEFADSIVRNGGLTP